MQPVKFVNTTNFLSQKLFESHLKLYEGYIKKINEITADLKNEGDREAANSSYSKYRGLKKGETYVLNGAILHELYFQNIGGEKTKPCEKTIAMMQESFGGLEEFEKDLTACGNAARGWAALVYEQRTKGFKNILMDLHNEGMVTSSYPILLLDMYEHAYAMDYGIDKGEYIKNFLNDINWEIVEKRISIIL